MNNSGTLSNAGGLIVNNGQYTISGSNLTVTYTGEQPTRADSQTYNSFGDNFTATNQPLSSVACFVSGTRITTARGEILVEALSIGDLVQTESGEYRPIRWLGKRSYVGRFANANPDVLPVCFKAGSLDNNIPARDLWVSPKHAMFLDGALVPAEHLVNGTTVIKATRVERVDYHHVELESHDVLIAEGAPSESFVDDAGRHVFHNAEEHAALYPDEERTEAVYFAPRLEQGHALEAIRRRIEARAELLKRDRKAA